MKQETKRKIISLLSVIAMTTLIILAPASVGRMQVSAETQKNSLSDYQTSEIIDYLSKNGYVVASKDNVYNFGYITGGQFYKGEWTEQTNKGTGIEKDLLSQFNKGFNDGFDKAEADAKSAEPVYIGNKSTKKYHKATCSSVLDMKPSNKVTNTKEYFESNGYAPCKKCNP